MQALTVMTFKYDYLLNTSKENFSKYAKVQRKWRERELEIVRKKHRDIEELESARAQQIRQKQKGRAMIVFEREEEAQKNALQNEQLKIELLESQNKKKQVTSLFQQ